MAQKLAMTFSIRTALSCLLPAARGESTIRRIRDRPGPMNHKGTLKKGLRTVPASERSVP